MFKLWVTCRLWATTNLAGGFPLTFPHGPMHIWVEYISPLLLVNTAFSCNPQPLSSSVLSWGWYCPSCCCVLPVHDRNSEILSVKYKKTQHLFIYFLHWQGQLQVMWKPGLAVLAPDHLYSRHSSAHSPQLCKQLGAVEEDRKGHLFPDNCRENIVIW